VSTSKYQTGLKKLVAPSAAKRRKKVLSDCHQFVNDVRFFTRQRHDVHVEADEAVNQLVLGHDLGILFGLRGHVGRWQNLAALIGGRAGMSHPRME